MSLDNDEIKDIARLARLLVNETDTEVYARELSAILELVTQMQAIDTAAVPPLAHPLDMVQRLRVDEVSEKNQREHYQTIAPQTEAGLYLVPKVIE